MPRAAPLLCAPLAQLQAHHKDTLENKEKNMQDAILHYQQEAELAKLELERVRQVRCQYTSAVPGRA